MKNYIFLLFFCCTFLFGFLGGDGSLENPYQISSSQHLISINNDLYANYVLMNNISFVNDWVPIVDFSGSFDGGNNTISGIFINLSEENRPLLDVLLDRHNEKVGFFSSVIDGKVSNLKLSDIYVSGEYEVGSLSGYSKDANFSNVSVSGVIDGYDFIGGLVGVSEDSAFENSSFNGIIKGRKVVGGLVGELKVGNVFDSSFNGVITAEQMVGGLIGRSYGVCSISNSSVDGKIDQMLTLLRGEPMGFPGIPNYDGFYAKGFDHRVNDFIGLNEKCFIDKDSLSNISISYVK